MSKFLVAGIIQKETIVKVDEIPVPYKAVTDTTQSIHSSIGGDAYNEAVALKWLGNLVDFFTMIGKYENTSIINSNPNDVRLYTDYVLPKLNETPAAVIFYDSKRNQQIFEDIKDMRDAEFDLELFRKQLPTADMVILANANFCRPLLQLSLECNKKIAVNIRKFSYETEIFNRFFLENADILYMSDDDIEGDPYDFCKYIVDKYHPEVLILGQGASGLIIYSSKEESYLHYNPVKTNEIVNTVGAGNALFSCFLHYYNKTGDSTLAIKNALLFASYKIGFVGTSNGFMTEEQISNWHSLIWKDSKPVF